MKKKLIHLSAAIAFMAVVSCKNEGNVATADTKIYEGKEIGTEYDQKSMHYYRN